MFDPGTHGSGPGEISPDGSSVELYARLPENHVAATMIHKAIPAGATVLELGAGTGRVTHPLLALGHPVVAEGFPDRAYAADGSLAPRGTPGAIVHDAELAAQRALRMVREGTVEAIDGTVVQLEPGTLCIHGDNPGSVATAQAIRAALEGDGVTIAPF